MEELETLVRLRLITHNARLVNARREQGWTQAEVAKWAGMRLSRLSAIENLRVIPTDLEMDDLAAVLGKSVDHLFPETLSDAIDNGVFNHRVANLSEPRVAALERGISLKALPTVSDDYLLESAAQDELQRQIAQVLDTLKPRERQVLELRYGLDDGHEKTLTEAGKAVNLTAGRIGQIQAAAIKHLRHHSRSRKLKGYLD